MKERIARELDAARRRSAALLEPLDDTALTVQHSPLMSPLVWDLAHVANYEELWLLRAVTGAEPMLAVDVEALYDAFRHPRRERPSLPILGPPEARAYAAAVRGRVLDALEEVDLDDGRELLAGAFVYGMVAQHEHQHDETILATLQLMADPYLPDAPPPPPGGPVGPAEVLVDGGPFVMGTDDPWAYDNERPAHTVDLPPFLIDTAPVANAAFAEFVRDTGAEPPLFWSPDCAARTRFGWVEEVPPDEPVQHVTWHQAAAFAAWAGKRLPTEAEWEKAASWDPAAGAKRRYPWGDQPPDATRANLGQRHFRPAPVGAYPAGVSAYGCHQMLGDVWEWTVSDLAGYPGFRSFPYPEYSEAFFGPEYKVLRGGSWAVDPLAARTTFRNWDYPVRRQIFAGFRCARDV